MTQQRSVSVGQHGGEPLPIPTQSRMSDREDFTMRMAKSPMIEAPLDCAAAEPECFQLTLGDDTMLPLSKRCQSALSVRHSHTQGFLSLRTHTGA